VAKFTEAETTTLKRILYGTWEYIGNDIMQAVQEEGRYDIPREDVIEVVLDADHAQKMVGELKAKALWEKFEKLTYKERIAFCKKHVFPYPRYS
jgi:hypothetical protein